jgi:hypothetical protein
MRGSATRVLDMVLDRVDGMSSLVQSLSSAVGLIDDHIDTVATNGVYWGTRSVLVATLSQFPELGAELELLGSGHNVDLTKDQVDALWTQTRQTLDTLASFVTPSVTRGSLDGAREG